ncbi:MAG: hypothetical protein A2X46_11285 [Lentisphaerae bacterium GWF2_57_35]|nr:MAG: hypothetical protein A2X46_11285 [Lentisphaerae bacterium GWF2_57_35]
MNNRPVKQLWLSLTIGDEWGTYDLMLQAWLMRRLRCYQWKQWGRRGYRELRRRGVSRKLAWNTSKSAHGPWRLSQSPALCFALPSGFFIKLGLPSLIVNGMESPGT